MLWAGDEWWSLGEQVNGGLFTGGEALQAYQDDHGTLIHGFQLVCRGNFHGSDGTYQSKFFSQGEPNYSGTVGASNLQDLIMEPVADYLIESGGRNGLVSAIEWRFTVLPCNQELVLSGEAADILERWDLSDAVLFDETGEVGLLDDFNDEFIDLIFISHELHFDSSIAVILHPADDIEPECEPLG